MYTMVLDAAAKCQDRLLAERVFGEVAAELDVLHAPQVNVLIRMYSRDGDLKAAEGLW